MAPDDHLEGTEPAAPGPEPIAPGSTSPVLDEAFDRMAASDFELPNGFVNHGPMACEALAVLGCDDRIDAWARRAVAATGEGPVPVASAGGLSDWHDALGRYDRLPEWLGYFEAAIGEAGWRTVVADWVPRLVPALSAALFHGAIRTAHAVRAVAATDTPARRSELARALGYWSARYRAGASPTGPRSTDAQGLPGTGEAATAEAATGAHHYLAAPNIFNLHGVTGAMAVELLAPHLAPEDRVAALAQLRADHAALYAGGDSGVGDGAGWDTGVIERAAASGDPHQVKLVEACRRALRRNGDPVFAAAATTVTGPG